MAYIYIAGHRGMVGSALVREATRRGHHVIVRSREELDLCDQRKVHEFLDYQKPDIVIMAAAKVGGIHANATYPAEFLYENLTMSTNVIEGARRAGVGNLLFLGSSCIYPRKAPQPMEEDCLLTSPLEPTNEAYAVAKIAGLKMCQHYRSQYGLNYRSVMPGNLYGPGDNYHEKNSHVIPALIRRLHAAKEKGSPEVVIWGTGTPRREFLYVDDLASACFEVIESDHLPDWVNVGSGQELTIMELAWLIAEVVGYTGNIATDPRGLDGAPRKLLDNSVIETTGWAPFVSLREGLELAYLDFKESLAKGTARI